MSHIPNHAMRFFWTDPSYSSVLERVAEFWDLSGRLPVPLEASDLFCHVCGHDQVRILTWKFHQYNSKDGKTTPFRCDVRTKCTVCSHVMVFGVATPQEMNEYWGFKTEITDREALRGVEPS